MQLIPRAQTGVKIDQRIIDDVIRRLKLVENNKNNPNSGWDKKKNRWVAHKSPEGGYETIAWGIKLDPNNPDIKDLYDLYKSQKYLTDAQIDAALPAIVTNYHNRAKKLYSNLGYNWDDLDWKAKSILTDYAYNPSISQFPNFAKGFATGNYDLITNNSHRALNGYALTQRNNIIDKEIKDWVTEQKKLYSPQIWRFGNRPIYNEKTETITYPVKNGLPGTAQMIVTEHWFGPNDTTIVAKHPNGKVVTSNADYGLFWDDVDENFADLKQRFDHDKSISLIKKSK